MKLASAATVDVFTSHWTPIQYLFSCFLLVEFLICQTWSAFRCINGLLGEPFFVIASDLFLGALHLPFSISDTSIPIEKVWVNYNILLTWIVRPFKGMTSLLKNKNKKKSSMDVGRWLRSWSNLPRTIISYNIIINHKSVTYYNL